MTAKQTAILNVSKMVIVALLSGALTMALLAHVPLPYLGIGACVIIMLVLVHMIYELELSKAQYRETLLNLKKDLEG